MIRDNIEYRGYRIRRKPAVYNIYKDNKFIGDVWTMRAAKEWVDGEIEDAAADAERHAEVSS